MPELHFNSHSSSWKDGEVTPILFALPLFSSFTTKSLFKTLIAS